MPTKTKPEERVGELEERLSVLEQQRRQAADAIALAEQRTEEIAGRQQQIAVAVVGEDPEAVTENERLEEALLIENRRRATARSAAEQLDAQIEHAKEELVAEERRIHLEQGTELARERYTLEGRAEEEIGALFATLSELAQLDQRQREKLRLAGKELPRETFNQLLESWLSARFGGAEGYLPTLSLIEYYRHYALGELDPLAKKRG
jgi:hypothetical protein